jgi:hypothetical protein
MGIGGAARLGIVPKIAEGQRYWWLMDLEKSRDFESRTEPHCRMRSESIGAF